MDQEVAGSIPVTRPIIFNELDDIDILDILDSSHIVGDNRKLHAN